MNLTRVGTLPLPINNDFAYKDQFNAALKMLKDNGTLDKLVWKMVQIEKALRGRHPR